MLEYLLHLFSQDKEFKEGGFKLNWNYNSTTNEVTFKITVNVTGWIGVGFSESNEDMEDMDIAIAIVKSSGQGTVEVSHIA